ncbi:MAG: acyl-CoA thioesterase [Deltaproteobacteria bacterium]|nr:MAG: acyl-CoA thioesterase [Deltaproteobacteria bacterium]
MNELVLPTHTNSLGTIFGGQIMAWIDICAGMAAMRHARAQCVTASMDALDFIAPARLGELVNLKGMVNYVGRTSLEVGVRVEAEDPRTGVRRHTASAYLTFVAIADDGTPIPVRRLEPSTPSERLRYEEAEARRGQRLALARERARLRAEHDQRAGRDA